MRRYIGIFFILLGIIIVVGVAYVNSPYSQTTRSFSPYLLMTSSFQSYKKDYINGDGRVVDYSENSITTSEGQSYALLRAVWVDDKQTFDLLWKWTKENMQRKSDHLFSWRWGKLQNGGYGTLSGGGENSATDADEDIALALILAGHRWGNQTYIDEAKKIIPDIWKEETDTVNSTGNRYVLAGNWAAGTNELAINPSYFSPYTYRMFASLDKQHDWASLITPGYQMLSDAGKTALNTGHGVGLPPDWLTIQKDNGTMKVTSIANTTSNYSFDAMRVPFRVALDYQWFHSEEAKQYLVQNYTFLADQYNNNHTLAAGYTHDGKPLQQKENPVMYSTIIGYFMITQPSVAKDIYTNKILKLYSNDQNSFNSDVGYYGLNWLWFGAALYNNYLHKY